MALAIYQQNAYLTESESKTDEIMEEETMTVLAAYNSVMEAEMNKSKLERAGIWSTIRNEYMSALYPTGAMPAELVVRSEDLEKAREALR